MNINLQTFLVFTAFVFILYTIVRVIMETTSSAKALGYVLLCIALPVVGSLIYFSFGVNYRNRKLFSKKLNADKTPSLSRLKAIQNNSAALFEESKKALQQNKDMFKLLFEESHAPLSANQLKLLVNGESKFPLLLEDLKNATQFIHIEYYIYEDDLIGKQVQQLLIQKALQGVKVRFIYDDFGSHSLKKEFINKLKDSGVEVYPFFKLWIPLAANRINYRNHRKVIIVDGKIGYLGGINISDRYINNNPKQLFWRDTHLRIEGLAVGSLQYHFLADWNFCSNQNIEITPELFPDVPIAKNDGLVQIVASGPDYPNATIMLSYFTAIVNANEKVYITTPYFIPNSSIINALKKAALSGKDVRLLVPKKSDSRIVSLASESFYQELMECGVKIYLYQKGFIHAKTIIADSNLSIVATANIDFRSFELNFEMAAVIYSTDFCKELTDVFLADLKESRELDLNIWMQRSKWKFFKERVCRLFSALL